jgi:hypothetical protein
MADHTHKPLRGKDYAAAPETQSYPEPTEAEQEAALRELQRRANTRRRAK